MRIHILGICGTFMGGLAIIARQLGHTVTGSDAAVYPPMSTQLEEQGITLFNGFAVENLQQAKPDLTIIGNAIKRGNPEAEYVLNNRLPYTSGPGWLADEVLRKRIVLGIAGTHGKTTTTAMLAWILQAQGLNPGFLIGGVPKNFTASANLGQDPYFVIEADEYDTAFFDKRSKFIQYHLNVAVLNNLEFDHGDIFKDLEAIKVSFSHLVRTIPSEGLIIYAQNDANLRDVISRSCWTPTETFGAAEANWIATNISPCNQQFDILYNQTIVGRVDWQLLGQHNIHNCLAAIAAANKIGIKPEAAIKALNSFAGVKRRLEIRGVANGVTVYDDFAHHPTAIIETIKALRAKVNKERIIAIIEFGSNTMRAGMHHEKALAALNGADLAFILKPQADWDVAALTSVCTIPVKICDSVETIITETVTHAKTTDHILIMSNKGFGGIHDKMLKQLKIKNEKCR